MNIRSAALAFAVLVSFTVCAVVASAGTMTAYGAEDYPSLHAAIDGLAGPAADAVTSQGSAAVKRIAVTGAAPVEHLRRAGAAVAKHLPGGRYTLSDPAASHDAVMIEVNVREVGTSQAGWQSAPVAHGVISLTVIAAGGRQSFTARYQEKPWADDFAAFANANPGRRWIVGRTGRPWGSQGEASADALASAAEALVPVVRGRLKRPHRNAAADDGRLRQIILEDLRAGRLVTDRFTQRFARPYGDVWNEAVLVDAAPDKLKSLAERCARESRGREARTARTLAVGGGLVVGLSVLYLCLNAFTRGYFTWRLRAVTVLLGVVGLFVLTRIA